MRRRSAWRQLAPLALGLAIGAAGCASSRARVDPEEMSAEQHRAEAERERQKAARKAAQFTPGAAQPSPFRERDSSDWSGAGAPFAVYNPTEVNLRAADQHHAHATQHEKAAKTLEASEDAECKGLDQRERAGCPLLGPATAITDVPGGVRVELAEGATDRVVLRMRCHQAYARARGWPEPASCPLYMKGVDIRRSGDRRAVEILTKSSDKVALVRRLAREEAVGPATEPKR